MVEAKKARKTEYFVTPVDHRKRNCIQLEEQLEALNRRGEYMGLKGEFSYNGDMKGIIFVPYTEQNRPKPAQNGCETDLRELGLDVVG